MTSPKTKKSKQADEDSPWKEVLERYLEAFLAFFFPEAHADEKQVATDLASHLRSLAAVIVIEIGVRGGAVWANRCGRHLR